MFVPTLAPQKPFRGWMKQKEGKTLLCLGKESYTIEEFENII
jgi:hypothetical protein